MVLYITPFKLFALLSGYYFMRHPKLRHRIPSAPLNFFRRLPAMSDSMLWILFRKTYMSLYRTLHLLEIWICIYPSIYVYKSWESCIFMNSSFHKSTSTNDDWITLTLLKQRIQILTFYQRKQRSMKREAHKSPWAYHKINAALCVISSSFPPWLVSLCDYKRPLVITAWSRQQERGTTTCLNGRCYLLGAYMVRNGQILWLSSRVSTF